MKNISLKLRPLFTEIIAQAMDENLNIWVIAGDLGYKMWDKVRLRFPERFVNIAEQRNKQ